MAGEIVGNRIPMFIFLLFQIGTLFVQIISTIYFLSLAYFENSFMFSIPKEVILEATLEQAVTQVKIALDWLQTKKASQHQSVTLSYVKSRLARQ